MNPYKLVPIVEADGVTPVLSDYFKCLVYAQVPQADPRQYVLRADHEKKEKK